MKITLKSLLVAAIFCVGLFSCPPRSVADSSRAELDTSARQALQDLCKTTPAAAALREKAVAVLVFPKILKGGFIIAGQYGDGVLFKHGKVDGYYNSISASFGLQAGAQRFGYALFFMTEDDLRYLSSSKGWEVGALPSLTVVDVGVARSLSTTTVQQGIYAFFFGQMGLMGGLSLQGTKITQIKPGHD